MNRLPSILLTLSLPLLGTTCGAACADETVIQQSTEESSSSSSTSQSYSTSRSAGTVTGGSSETGVKSEDNATVLNIFAPKFRQRLKDIGEQIDLGLSKGWLTQEEAVSFRKQQDSVSSFESEVRSKGYQQADVDALEKQVTALNDAVSRALVKGSSPAPAAGAAGTAPEHEAGAGQKTVTPAAPAQPEKRAQSPASKPESSSGASGQRKGQLPAKSPAHTGTAAARSAGKRPAKK